MIYVCPAVHFNWVALHVDDCKWEFSFIYIMYNNMWYPQLFKKKKNLIKKVFVEKYKDNWACDQ